MTDVRVLYDDVDTQFFLQKRRFSYFLIIAIGCVNNPKYLFLPECSFKICEKPLQFF